MGNEVNNNPWATALPSSGDNAQGKAASPNSFIAFTKSEVNQPARHLEYILDEETFSINGDAYDGFNRIWKILLGGRKQLNDMDVVKTLRSSGMTDETLGDVWQEASHAILLEFGPDHPNDTEIEDAMEWQDFIILLDICYRMSASDLESFLKRFPLPSGRTTAMRRKKNPFQTPSDSASPMSSPDLARSVHSMSPTDSNRPQSLVSSYPASPESSHSRTDKVVNSPAPYHESGLENAKPNVVSPPIPPKASGYLEDLQDSHADGLKEYNAVYGASTVSGLETASISTFSSAPEVYDSDMMPLLPGASRMAGIDVVKSGSDASRQRPTSFDEQSDYSGLEASEPPRSPSIRRKELPHASKSAHRGSLQGITNEPTPGSGSPVDQRIGNPPLHGLFEMEAAHCTPETRRIAQNRLIEIEGSDASVSSGDMLRGYLKNMSLSRSKRDQGNGQFSLSTLATGLERAANEGSLPIIQALFEFGADPNYSVRGSNTIRHRALDFAAISGHSLIVDFLIHRGADSTAINTALLHAVLAERAELATRLIVAHHADVDSGVYLQHHNPDYGSFARTGLRSHIEYHNVLSAASKMADKDERVRFIRLLVSRKCNLNAYTWKVYKLKETISPVLLTPDEKEGKDRLHYGVPKIVHDGFGYSPLAHFTPLCSASVKLLLRAGAAAFTTSQKPPHQILDGFKQRGFSCHKFDIVQPISCITSEAWQLHPAECVETVEVLAQYGSKLSCDEPNGYEEKHGWRHALWGAFEERWSPSSTPLTPIKRAKEGKSQEGIACLLRLGANTERGFVS